MRTAVNGSELLVILPKVLNALPNQSTGQFINQPLAKIFRLIVKALAAAEKNPDQYFNIYNLSQIFFRSISELAKDDKASETDKDSEAGVHEKLVAVFINNEQGIKILERLFWAAQYIVTDANNLPKLFASFEVVVAKHFPNAPKVKEILQAVKVRQVMQTFHSSELCALYNAIDQSCVALKKGERLDAITISIFLAKLSSDCRDLNAAGDYLDILDLLETYRVAFGSNFENFHSKVTEQLADCLDVIVTTCSASMIKKVIFENYKLLKYLSRQSLQVLTYVANDSDASAPNNPVITIREFIKWQLLLKTKQRNDARKKEQQSAKNQVSTDLQAALISWNKLKDDNDMKHSPERYQEILDMVKDRLHELSQTDKEALQKKHPDFLIALLCDSKAASFQYVRSLNAKNLTSLIIDCFSSIEIQFESNLQYNQNDNSMRTDFCNIFAKLIDIFCMEMERLAAASLESAQQVAAALIKARRFYLENISLPNKSNDSYFNKLDTMIARLIQHLPSVRSDDNEHDLLFLTLGQASNSEILDVIFASKEFFDDPKYLEKAFQEGDLETLNILLKKYHATDTRKVYIFVKNVRENSVPQKLATNFQDLKFQEIIMILPVENIEELFEKELRRDDTNRQVLLALSVIRLVNHRKISSADFTEAARDFLGKMKIFAISIGKGLMLYSALRRIEGIKINLPLNVLLEFLEQALNQDETEPFIVDSLLEDIKKCKDLHPALLYKGRSLWLSSYFLMHQAGTGLMSSVLSSGSLDSPRPVSAEYAALPFINAVKKLGLTTPQVLQAIEDEADLNDLIVFLLRNLITPKLYGEFQSKENIFHYLAGDATASELLETLVLENDKQSRKFLDWNTINYQGIEHPVCVAFQSDNVVYLYSILLLIVRMDRFYGALSDDKAKKVIARIERLKDIFNEALNKYSESINIENVGHLLLFLQEIHAETQNIFISRILAIVKSINDGFDSEPEEANPESQEESNSETKEESNEGLRNYTCSVALDEDSTVLYFKGPKDPFSRDPYEAKIEAEVRKVLDREFDGARDAAWRIRPYRARLAY